MFLLSCCLCCKKKQKAKAKATTTTTTSAPFVMHHSSGAIICARVLCVCVCAVSHTKRPTKCAELARCLSAERKQQQQAEWKQRTFFRQSALFCALNSTNDAAAAAVEHSACTCLLFCAKVEIIKKVQLFSTLSMSHTWISILLIVLSLKQVVLVRSFVGSFVCLFARSFN